jgi:hypothetical protein
MEYFHDPTRVLRGISGVDSPTHRLATADSSAMILICTTHTHQGWNGDTCQEYIHTKKARHQVVSVDRSRRDAYLEEDVSVAQHGDHAARAGVDGAAADLGGTVASTRQHNAARRILGIKHRQACLLIQGRVKA